LAPFEIETRVEKHLGDKSISGLFPFKIEIKVGKTHWTLSLSVKERDMRKW